MEDDDEERGRENSEKVSLRNEPHGRTLIEVGVFLISAVGAIAALLH